LSSVTLSHIRLHGINNIPATIRGPRAGKNVQRPISVVSFSDTKPSNESQSGPNFRNLSTVKQIPSANVKAGVLNCRSVKNKTDLIVEHIMDSGLDVLALTETWLTSNNSDQRTDRKSVV
jgi:hypothetical protein